MEVSGDIGQDGHQKHEMKTYQEDANKLVRVHIYVAKHERFGKAQIARHKKAEEKLWGTNTERGLELPVTYFLGLCMVLQRREKDICLCRGTYCETPIADVAQNTSDRQHILIQVTIHVYNVTHRTTSFSAAAAAARVKACVDSIVQDCEESPESICGGRSRERYWTNVKEGLRH